MRRDFLKEFRNKIKQVDNPETPKPRYEEPKAEPIVKRFNIHKRSLPPGIDIIVVFGVTKQEAEWWIEKRLKAKCYQDDARDTKTLVYYDVVPVNASPRERSIYFNPSPSTTETVPGFNTPERIN